MQIIKQITAKSTWLNLTNQSYHSSAARPFNIQLARYLLNVSSHVYGHYSLDNPDHSTMRQNQQAFHVELQWGFEICLREKVCFLSVKPPYSTSSLAQDYIQNFRQFLADVNTMLHFIAMKCLRFLYSRRATSVHYGMTITQYSQTLAILSFRVFCPTFISDIQPRSRGNRNHGEVHNVFIILP